MRQYDYERDEVIRHGKKKTTKPKTPKSKHKHIYVEKFIPKDGTGFNVDRTEYECSICGRIGDTKYHFSLFTIK